MSVFRQVWWLSLLVVAASLNSRSQATTSDTSAFLGEFRDGVYRNAFFGFQMEVPKGWESVNELDKKVADDIARELLRKEGADWVPPKFNSIDLLNLRKLKIGMRGNALLRIMVTKQPSTSTTPAMVAELSRRRLVENPFAVTVGDVKHMVVAGRRFAGFDYTVKSTTERPVKSRYLQTTDRGYSIGFVTSFVLEEDEKLLEGVIRSLAFK